VCQASGVISCDYPDHPPAEPGPEPNIYDPGPPGQPEFIEPANIKNFFWRIPELWTDPSCNQLSASRFVLVLMGLLTVFVSVWMTVNGQGNAVTTLITAVTATVASVYFASTIKDWRWRRREDKE
jgi:hypothetical protein